MRWHECVRNGQAGWTYGEKHRLCLKNTQFANDKRDENYKNGIFVELNDYQN